MFDHPCFIIKEEDILIEALKSILYNCSSSKAFCSKSSALGQAEGNLPSGGVELSGPIILCPSRCLSTGPDPDPHGSALIWVAGSGSAFKLRIRIRSRRAKMTHKNRKKYRIFMFWSAGCSFLRAEGFSCSLGVLYGGLGISKLQFLIKKTKIKFPAVNFIQF